jgi:hypothetical protein
MFIMMQLISIISPHQILFITMLDMLYGEQIPFQIFKF